jgi:hypothetical protein
MPKKLPKVRITFNIFGTTSIYKCEKQVENYEKMDSNIKKVLVENIPSVSAG